MTSTAATARRFFDWAFRSREDGRITIAQRPNAPLLLWAALAAARFVLRPEGRLATALDVAASSALLVWALLEVFRGVNPFRRALGGAVLVGLVASPLARLS